MKNHRKKYVVIMAAGLLMITAALGLTVKNMVEQESAKHSSEEIIAQLDTYIDGENNDSTTFADTASVVPDYVIDPMMTMPVYTVGDYACVAKLELPTLGLELPVLDTLSNYNLTVAPCRYTGSAYTNDLIIAAHNYTNHFGRLLSLRAGDPIILTDTDGNVFDYTVTSLEEIDGENTDGMLDGKWDLTLFTCTWSGQSRVTVRCDRVIKDILGDTNGK